MTKEKMLVIIVAVFLFLSVSNVFALPSNYKYEKHIFIGTTTESLPSYYVVNASIDTSSLISSGRMQSDCGDLRVYYNDNVELDRVVHRCNTTGTWVEFKLVNSIGTSQNATNYSFYYGNSNAASPPSDWGNVYWFSDDFGSLNTSKWSTRGTVSVFNSYVNITQSSWIGTFGDLESKKTDFAPPFSLEMGNTYWVNEAFNTVIRRQLNITDQLLTDFRAGLYFDSSVGEWIWFSVNNTPPLGSSCAFSGTVSHNRTLVVRNVSLAEYYQDGILVCVNSTSHIISNSTHWSVDLQVATASGTISQLTDWVIMRKLTSEAAAPVVLVGAESVNPYFKYFTGTQLAVLDLLPLMIIVGLFVQIARGLMGGDFDINKLAWYIVMILLSLAFVGIIFSLL